MYLSSNIYTKLWTASERYIARGMPEVGRPCSEQYRKKSTHSLITTMIQKKEYHSGNPGKTLLVFGAIHGDEICGPKAIAEVMNEIDSGKIVLKSGKIIFVPVCNPEAFKQNKRFVDVNLNRVFKKHPNPTKYEEKLANILCDFMGDADILLDIHSISSE